MTNLFMAKALTVSLAAATMLAISGCATTTSPESRLAYDQTQKSLANQPVTVLSDGCLIRVEMGKNDILYQQSDAASVAMMHTVKEALNEKGLTVTRTTAPFVCGTLTKEALTKMDIAATASTKEQPNTAYPLLSAGNSFDTATNQAYLTLFSTLNKAKRQEIEAAKGASIELALDQTILTAIQKMEGTDKVFVSMVTGSKPSFGYSMAVGVTTAVATAGTGFSAPQQGQFHHLYLLNLKTNKIEWGKTAAFNGQVFKMPVNERFAYKGILAPLYAE